MTRMQPAGRLEALVERAEYHRENGAEGTMKAADRIGKCVRVLLDCSGNPRVRELEQQCAAGAQKYRRLAIDAPGHRLRTEYAGE